MFQPCPGCKQTGGAHLVRCHLKPKMNRCRVCKFWHPAEAACSMPVAFIDMAPVEGK
jgi:hypothetical protein